MGGNSGRRSRSVKTTSPSQPKGRKRRHKTREARGALADRLQELAKGEFISDDGALIPVRLWSGDLVGIVSIDSAPIRTAMIGHLRSLGLPESKSLVDVICLGVLHDLAAHAERWVNGELLERPVLLALARRFGPGALLDPRFLLHHWSRNPDVLLEALSLPTVRRQIRRIRTKGTTKQRARLMELLGRAGRKSAGAPKKAIAERSEVEILMRYETAKTRLQAGFAKARELGPLRKDPEVLYEHLAGMSYSHIEIEAMAGSDSVGAAAKRVISKDLVLKVSSINTAISRGRRLRRELAHRGVAAGS